MKTPAQPLPFSLANLSPTSGRTALLIFALLCSSGALRAQTTFLGSWDQHVGGVFSDTIDETLDSYDHTYPDGSTGHYRPGYIFVGIREHDYYVGILPGTEINYQWREVISEPTTTHHTSNDWSVANAWSAGRPDPSTDARIFDSRAINLPGVHEDPAAARTLRVYDAHSTGSQSVTLRDGTLNLTPASVFDTALKVGVASATGESRSSSLILSDVTLTSSGFAEVGKGLPAGSGGGELTAVMTMTDNSRWLHQAGLIEIGGGTGFGMLTVGTGSLLVGSLLPGTGLDPQVIVNDGSTLSIEAGGAARLSEIGVNSRGAFGYSGLSVLGALETSRLTVGETSAGRAYFGVTSTSNVGDVSIKHGNSSHTENFVVAGATVQTNSFTVDDGLIHVWGSQRESYRGSLTIGTAASAAAQERVLTLGAASGTSATVRIYESDVIVHGRASLGHFGSATVKIEPGGVLDIRGDAVVGYSDSTAAGHGNVTISGAGSVLRAQNMEVGYSYFDTYSHNPYPSPTGSVAIGANGRLEIVGRSETYNRYIPGIGSFPITVNYAGSLAVGKNGTLDILDDSAKVVFTDPSNGGTLDSNARLINYGTIKGGGPGPGAGAHIDFGAQGGTLVNYGTIDVGHSPGWLTVNGNVSFVQPDSWLPSGRLKIELGGITAGAEYDVFEVWGNADFTGGTLELSFLDGYHPQAGDYWDFLRVSGRITGWFSNFVVTEGYESYLTALQGWNGGSNFRLHAGNFGGGGGGSSVPEGGATGLLLTASLVGLLLLKRRPAEFKVAKQAP